jgi:CBS domain-containing protein
MTSRATKVEEVMTPDPTTVTAESSVGDAYDRMKASGFRHLPVVSDDQLLGIVSMTDIGHLGSQVPEIRARTVGEVMTRKLLTIAPGERVEVAAAQMAHRKVHCLPVVEGTRLVGIVTTYDLLDALARSLRTEE